MHELRVCTQGMTNAQAGMGLPGKLRRALRQQLQGTAH